MPRANYRLKEKRQALGLTQEELAEEAGVSRRTVQRAEEGNEHTIAVLESLAAAVDLEYDEIVDNQIDAFSDWPWKLFQYLKPSLLPKADAYCLDELDAIAAIRRMREQWFHHLKRTESSLLNQEHFEANDLLNSEYQEYQERYVRIWKKNPSSFLYAVNNGIRVGLCFVLPVTDAAFERLLNGEISFMDISAGDVLVQSQNIILDSAVEFENASKKPWFQLTDDLSFAIFHSIASLSVRPLDRSFRLLGFGASATNLDRLRTVGFQATGTKMPKYGYEICVFSSSSRELKAGTSHDQFTTLGHYARLLKRIIPRKPSLQTKRRLVSLALQAYKSIASRYESHSRVA